MPIRTLVAIALGIVTAFALFWVMQALIGVEGELKDAGTRLSVDFVRLKRDNRPQTKEREPPKLEKPEQQPPPPEMNLAKNMNPGDAVGEIIPMMDTGMELEKATSLGTGAGSDHDVVPLVRVDPEYPPRARQQGIEGWVEIEFTISPVGTVQDAFVLRAHPPACSTGPRFAPFGSGATTRKPRTASPSRARMCRSVCVSRYRGDADAEADRDVPNARIRAAGAAAGAGAPGRRSGRGDDRSRGPERADRPRRDP